MLIYPFTEEESRQALDEWGANCGPNALAFALGKTLDEVRPLLVGFEEKRYTNPTMMRDALSRAGVSFQIQKPRADDTMFQKTKSLVRIQWHGPWTEPGANPRWAYRQTHWICTFRCDDVSLVRGGDPWRCMNMPLVFDCNGRLKTYSDWNAEIVPLLTKSIPRANGDWSPTHVWRLINV